jgi:protein-tyrosine kinase
VKAKEQVKGVAPNPEQATEIGVRIGRRLVEKGKISEEDIQRIVATQRDQGLMFGEAAVGLGLVTDDELQRALSEQFAYPYVEVIGSGLSALLSSAHQPFGQQAEAVRLLRSQLMLRWFNDRKNAIAVTAARGGDGSSVVAANLAICFAQLGERTLLVDANFRAPRQHELFALKNRTGLSTILTGRSKPSDAVVSIAPFKNLSVIPAGPTPPNPQELLGRIAFSYLIETAPTGFDFVIIDTPPILEYADAQIVASIASGCLLVTRRHHTRIADIKLSQAQLAPTGASLVGTVING